jgi:hypothetical protein
VLTGEQVFPSEGELAPESHVAIRVTFRCMHASVLDLDVPILVRTKPAAMEVIAADVC